MKQIVSKKINGYEIGYISDIHLETHKNKSKIINELINICQTKLDVLLLGGDIGDPYCKGKYYIKLLIACSYISKNVLLIPGNHEFYKQNNRFNAIHSILDTKRRLIEICNYVNNSDKLHQNGKIHFMDNNVFHLNDDICFIGSTLWSNIDKQEEPTIVRCINDYQCIPGFTADLSRNLYNECSIFINEQLLNNKKKVCCIVTHYAPSSKNVSSDEYKDSKINSAFSTDFVYTSEIRPICWFFGHTHFDVDRFDEDLGCELISNQYGYS